MTLLVKKNEITKLSKSQDDEGDDKDEVEDDDIFNWREYKKCEEWMINNCKLE